jgi:hypothetical protein
MTNYEAVAAYITIAYRYRDEDRSQEGRHQGSSAW